MNKWTLETDKFPIPKKINPQYNPTTNAHQLQSETLMDIKFVPKNSNSSSGSKSLITLDGDRMVDVHQDIFFDNKPYWYQVFDANTREVLVNPCSKLDLDEYLDMLTQDELEAIYIVKVDEHSNIIS